MSLHQLDLPALYNGCFVLPCRLSGFSVPDPACPTVFLLKALNQCASVASVLAHHSDAYPDISSDTVDSILLLFHSHILLENENHRESRPSSHFLLLSQESDPDHSTTDLQRSPDVGVPQCTPLSSHSLLSCPYIHSISHVLLHAAKKMDIIRSSFSVSLVSLLAFSFSSLLFPVQCMPVPLTL